MSSQPNLFCLTIPEEADGASAILIVSDLTMSFAPKEDSIVATDAAPECGAWQQALHSLLRQGLADEAILSSHSLRLRGFARERGWQQRLAADLEKLFGRPIQLVRPLDAEPPYLGAPSAE